MGGMLIVCKGSDGLLSAVKKDAKGACLAKSKAWGTCTWRCREIGDSVRHHLFTLRYDVLHMRNMLHTYFTSIHELLALHSGCAQHIGRLPP